MRTEHYDAGEVVPMDIRSDPDDEFRDDVRFAVSVEIYGGFGSAKHVYPTEPVESTADLFTSEQSDEESLVTEDVRLYTIPHDRLR